MGFTPNGRMDPNRPDALVRAAILQWMAEAGYRSDPDSATVSSQVAWLWRWGLGRGRARILRRLARAIDRRRRKRPAVRITPPPPDTSIQTWLKAHGHVIAAVPEPARRWPDPGEVALRWVRRTLHRRVRRPESRPAVVIDPAVEAWKTRHDSGAPRMVRPSGAALTPPTRRRRHPRRVFREELEAEPLELPLPSPPISRSRGELPGIGSATGSLPAPWTPRAPAHRRSGPVRVLLFALRALRRTVRMAWRLRPVPVPVVAPQPKGPLEDDELEASLQKVLERLFDGRFQDVRHSRDLLRGVRQLLEADTDRPLEKDLAQKDEQIQMLEQKIRRLAALLKENERQRELMRSSGGAKIQFVSGVGAVDPGVKSGDPKRKVKLDLMREIRAMNREIRSEVRSMARSVPPPQASRTPPTVPAVQPSRPAQPEPVPIPEPVLVKTEFLQPPILDDGNPGSTTVEPPLDPPRAE